MTTIEFEGRPVGFQEGDTVASALYRSGVRVFSRSFKYHRPRGLYCLTGDCPNCLVNVDDEPCVRACVTDAAAGQRVRRESRLALGRARRARPPRPAASAASGRLLLQDAGAAALAVAARRAAGAARDRPGGGAAGQRARAPRSAPPAPRRAGDRRRRRWLVGGAGGGRVRPQGRRLRRGPAGREARPPVPPGPGSRSWPGWRGRPTRSRCSSRRPRLASTRVRWRS